MVADQEPGGSQDCSILSVGQHQRLIKGYKLWYTHLQRSFTSWKGREPGFSSISCSNRWMTQRRQYLLLVSNFAFFLKKNSTSGDKTSPETLTERQKFLFRRIEKRPWTDMPLTARTCLWPRITLQPLLDHVFHWNLHKEWPFFIKMGILNSRPIGCTSAFPNTALPWCYWDLNICNARSETLRQHLLLKVTMV
jgi:hypothetical protein